MSSDLLRVAESVRLGSSSLPLLGSSNIWIDDSLADDSSIRLVQAIMLQALEGTAPGQLEIIVYDDGLSGLAAPFWPLNSAGEKILTILNDEQEFSTTLRYLRDHVQAVKNTIQGLATNLVTYRHQANYPVEGYKLVVVSTDFSTLDDENQAQMAILLKSGPEAGVSFIVHSMTLGANPYVIAMCEHLTLRGRSIEREDGDPIAGWMSPHANELIQASQLVADNLATTPMSPIDFTSIQGTGDRWRRTSEDGVTFAIGKYGERVVEVTLGDELNQRHNILVTGAVGQGKSNLISVIIHSLAERYSPRELEFYLLDFKEGVTLQAFFNESTGEYLPHARVLGLEADREFGLSVLQNLFDIYRSRMATFKAAGVQSLRQYRSLHPRAEMPRILVIIDEFQMMFAEKDKISDQIADLLVRGVRLFRASGIHVILASQTIGGNMSLMGSSGEGLFGQVPVRVALKNSLSESRATLGDKNDAAAHLRAREAIVNLDYGDVSANWKTSIAYADEKILAPLRRSWWESARSTTTKPFVFVGERRRSIVAEGGRVGELHHANVPTLLIGDRIQVDAHPLEVPFGRDIGRNVAVLGSGDAVAQIENMALSLAASHQGTDFVVLDFLDSNQQWNATRGMFVDTVSKCGSQIQVLDKAAAQLFMATMCDEFAERDDVRDLVVIGLGLDRFRAMPVGFQDLTRNGPMVGVHAIGWWLKIDSFRDQIGYGGESSFDVRLALRLDSQSTKSLMNDPLLEWRADDNRMLAWDAAELAEALRVIPYTIFDENVAQALQEICHT